jgi:hypothetical protein
MPRDPANHEVAATSEDVKGILGELDDSTLLAIIDLRPTIGELEEAQMWLSGDQDVFEPGVPLKGVAGEIVTILQSQEQNDERR